MSKLTMPVLSILFKEKAATLIARGERGIVALITHGTKDPYTVRSVSDIPEDETDENKGFLEDILKGYQNAPNKIQVYEIAGKTSGETTTYDYTDALKWAQTAKFQWLVAPYCEDDKTTESLATWVKGERTNDHMVKAVLPGSTKPDYEGIVWWNTILYKDSTTDGVTTRTEYKPAYTAPRIAGLIAGTSMTIAATYAPLNEFSDCERRTKDDMNDLIGQGQLIAFWDGEKVKLSRAVTSLITTTQDKGESFQKIKLVEDMDMIKDDLTTTIQDSYIGKYANSYDNKVLLMQAIKSYYDGLRIDGIIQSGSVSINIDKQRIYLEGLGKDVVVNNLTGETKKPTECSDDEIKMANTGSHVFLKCKVQLLDVMEDIDIIINV